MRGRLFALAAISALMLLASLASAEPNEGSACQRQVSAAGSLPMPNSGSGTVTHAAQLSPQAAKADQLHMRLRGTWTDGEDDFTFVFQAEVLVNNSLSGAFDWTLTHTAADSEYVSRIGATGKEFVEGKYSPASRIAIFKGIRVSDPSFLGTDSYCVLLSSDLTTFTGYSRSNYEDWRGRMKGTAELTSRN
jgi:hypothetical protein